MARTTQFSAPMGHILESQRNLHSFRQEPDRLTPICTLELSSPRTLERRRSAGNRDWVFPSPRSRSGHIVSVAKQFEQARRDADLPVTLVLYCARHTFATDLLAQTG